MTREQMVTEFGEPGVENARMVDLITRDSATDTVVPTTCSISVVSLVIRLEISLGLFCS